MIFIPDFSQLAAHVHLENEFNKRLAAADPATRASMLAIREGERAEATIECRHRELCDAIRDASERASFWP